MIHDEEDSCPELDQLIETLGECVMEAVLTAQQYMPPKEFLELRKRLEDKGFEFIAIPDNANLHPESETTQ